MNFYIRIISALLLLVFAWLLNGDDKLWPKLLLTALAISGAVDAYRSLRKMLRKA